MAKSRPPIVKRSIYTWIFGRNTKLQLVVLALIAVTVLARIIPLEMQKRIVNEAIRLSDIDLLIRYCAIYLVSVVAASGLKYLITILQVMISQRTLARMRKGLFAHIISRPLSFFRNTQPGLVVSSLISELTIPANFVGMAVAAPVINLLTLVAFAVYLFFLNPWLAALSLSIYPVVIFLVPLLQKRVNQANKKRVDTTRTFSDKVQETISGIHEVHGNGAYDIENRKIGGIVDQLYRIRLRWDFFRASVKVSNNFFTSLGPFLVFILGGYLTIQGQLELGALVAFLSAQEKLYDPWKEMIEFYQVYQEAKVSYKQSGTGYHLIGNPLRTGTLSAGRACGSEKPGLCHQRWHPPAGPHIDGTQTRRAHGLGGVFRQRQEHPGPMCRAALFLHGRAGLAR